MKVKFLSATWPINGLSIILCFDGVLGTVYLKKVFCYCTMYNDLFILLTPFILFFFFVILEASTLELE